jgi:hypothetical protein
MLVFIPIIAMIVLALIMPGTKKVNGRSFLLVLGVVFFLFLILRSFLPASFIDPEGEAVVRVRSQVDHLLKHQGWQQHPVVILVGSSATQYGINGIEIEHLLLQAGLPVTVLQFSLSGANHFERLFMMRLFLKEIGLQHREELQKAGVILLCEVFDAYDESPLYLFQKEAYTRRAITWFEPTQAWGAWNAWRASGTFRDLSLWVLWEHLLLNRFAVGSFSSLEPVNYNKKIEPFFPLTGIKKTFDYHDAEKTFKKTETKALSPQLYSGWKSYYQTLFQEMGGIITSLGFYALPTLEPQRRSYQNAFAAALPPHTTMIGPASAEFMNSLLNEKNWFDGVHPQAQGATIMTRWLAEEILEKWSSLMNTRWKMSTYVPISTCFLATFFS